MEKMDTTDKVYLILVSAMILGILLSASVRGKIS
jgi:hypothetical protein